MRKSENAENKKRSGKSNDKKAQLNIRLSQIEKRKLKRRAAKSGLTLSEYSRVVLFQDNKKNQSPEITSQCAILCQDILNVIQEKYSCEDNSILEEKVEKLWNLL